MNHINKFRPSHIHKSVILLLMLILAFAAVPTSAQDGSTQTLVSHKGLIFDYPADWFTNEFFGLVVVSSDEASVAGVAGIDPVNEDSVALGFIFGTPTELSEILGESVENLDQLRTLFSENIVHDGGTLISDEVVELGGRDVPVIVLESEGKTHLMYLAEVDGNLVIGVVFVNDPAQIDANRPILDSIIASLRYDPNATPTISLRHNFSTDAAEIGEGTFVYYQNFERDDANYTKLDSLDQIAQLTDGTVLVADGQSILTLDVETGALSNRVFSPNFFFPDSLVGAPDGNLWGYNSLDGLVKLSPNLETLLSTGTEVFGEDVSVRNIAVDAAGNVYVFASVRDEENNATGTVFIFNDAGEFQGSFVTNEEPDEFGTTLSEFDVWLFPQDDGNILLIDEFLYSKVVDTEGNLVSEPFRYGYDFDFFTSRDIDVADDGTLFVLTNDGTLRKYAPSGELVALVGVEKEDWEEPWVLGELPSSGGAILALDSNRVLVVGSNYNYSLLTLVDFSQLEAE